MNLICICIFIFYNITSSVPIDEVPFTALPSMRIRSIPNLSSLLGDVTADDVTLTSLSSSAESGRDVIASLRPSRDISRSRQHAAPTEFSPTGSSSGSESARVDDVTEKWRRRRKSESPKDARMQAAAANVDRDKRRRGHQTSPPTTSPSFFRALFPHSSKQLSVGLSRTLRSILFA